MRTLAELSSDDRAVAQERYQLLEPHIQGGRDLRSVLERTDVSLRALQRWVAEYKKSGLPVCSGESGLTAVAGERSRLACVRRW